METHQGYRNHARKVYAGYGQEIVSQVRRYIPVDLEGVELSSQSNVDYVGIFKESITRERDYSQYPITLPEDKMGLTSFFYSDGWMSHLETHSPVAIDDARRTHRASLDEGNPCPIEAHGKSLRQLAKEYVNSIQQPIRDHIHYGLMGLLGQSS